MNIITCSLSHIHEYEADTKYFIVLRPGKVHIDGLRHHPELAPSADLFNWAQQHKLEPGWFNTYTAWFQRDIRERVGLRDAIAKLETDAREKRILLVCFCPDVNQCHRGLIADELYRRGVQVLRK